MSRAEAQRAARERAGGDSSGEIGEVEIDTYIPLRATLAALHADHIRTRVAWSDCSQCNADTERRFARPRTPFQTRNPHVGKYLAWVKPRLEAIRKGEDSVNARRWHREFVEAMHRRINSHVAGRGRKWNDSYLERLSQFRRPLPNLGEFVGREWVGEAYLREFARRGASCLD